MYHSSCISLIILSTVLCTSSVEIEYPDTPGVVYGAVGADIFIPCDLSFPKDASSLELLMWYHGSVYILYKGKDGVLNYRDDTLNHKYNVVGENNTLSVRNVSRGDGGNYTCKASYFTNGGSALKEVNKTLELIVQEGLLNFTLIDPGDLDNSYYVDDDTATVDTATDSVHDTDTANNVTVSVSGDVTPDVPSAPGMPLVEEVGSREARISWAKSLRDNNSPIINYLVYVKKISDPDWSDSRVLQVGGGVSVIRVRDLAPYAAYQVQVVAKNALGNSVPSSQSSIIWTKPEAPSAPPQNLRVNETESSSLHLVWEPPPDDAINGEPGGYNVRYGKVGEYGVYAFTIESFTKTYVEIENLAPFTRYEISVAAFNDLSEGPPATIHVSTMEGVPAKPRITHYDEQKSKSFLVFWEAPKVENGILKNYQLQWINNNTYKTRIISGILKSPMSARILGLRPYTQYQLRVRAETGGGYSEYSDLFPAITDVAGPSAPKIVNLTVLSPTSIFVQWASPERYFKKVSSFFIHYWSTSDKNLRGERQVDGDQTEKIITQIATNSHYKLKIAGMTQSIFSESYYVGNFSDETEFTLQDPSVRVSQKPEVVSAGVIAGIVFAVLFVTVAILLFIGYRSMTCRKYTRSLYYLAVPTNSQSPQSTVVFPPETIDCGVLQNPSITCQQQDTKYKEVHVCDFLQHVRAMHGSSIDQDTKYKEVRVCDFLQHVRAMHADGDNGFSVDFDDITSRTRTDLSSDASFLPENKAKNRYVNISAFDHTRVILQPIPGKLRSSDYINGNFIDGYNKPNAYIATQGPLPHTFADFWRMIWEQGSVVIIMITNLVERGRRKCDMYWPEEGSETYGFVTVKHINTFSRAHYTVRMFSLKSSKIKKKHMVERIVYQYHYTEWPDHGVPEFTLPVLKFIQKSSHENPPGAGPIIIHCSAGVGRTGTYILIEAMIKQIKDKGTVNIPGFLLHIRQQRNFMVQTEEQYMLIHDAVAEYILTQGDTEVRECDVPKYTAELDRQVNGGLTSLDLQYALVTNYSPKPDDMFHALKSVNVCKNRSLDMVPLSVKRVVLPMKPGVEGSDYINATYLQGYNKSNEFIITQHPLDQTVEDFWRMVWDQNSSVIIQLSDTDDKDFKAYWPAKDCTFDIGCFKLIYREDDERKNYKIREFLLQSNQDDYILMTRIVTPNTPWPESCSPLHKVFDLVEAVQTLHKQNDIGPVIVVDRFGGEEAATFCGLWAIFDQLQYDKAINVYQLSKLYHLKRAGIIGSKERYLFMYQAAESLSKEWADRDRQSSPGSVRLHLGSAKRNGAMPRSVTINSKIETDV